MTEDRPVMALKQLIDNNQLSLKTKAWVERPGETPMAGRNNNQIKKTADSGDLR